MRYFIGIHTHRHGVSTYLFTTTGAEFGAEEFKKYLGSDFEPDRDDEFAEVEEVAPIEMEGR